MRAHKHTDTHGRTHAHRAEETHAAARAILSLRGNDNTPSHMLPRTKIQVSLFFLETPERPPAEERLDQQREPPHLDILKARRVPGAEIFILSIITSAISAACVHTFLCALKPFGLKQFYANAFSA